MRLFISIDLDEQLRKEIEKVQRLLKKVSPHALSCVKSNQLHLTIKFLGDIDEQNLSSLKERLKTSASKLKPFNFELGAISFFPLHGPLRLIWVTPQNESPTESLRRCHLICDEEIKALTANKDEDASFHPHITVARIQKDNKHQQDIKMTVPQIKIDPLIQTVTCLNLYRSTLTIHGAQHELIASEPL